MPEPAHHFDELVSAHRTRLRGWIRARVRDHALADDVEQETWLEVLRHADTFDETRGKFWTFVLIWAPLVLRRHRGVRPPDIAEVEPADPRPRQDARLMLARTASELLRRALGCARPPNEVVCFGFTKLGWKPSEITAQLLDEPLGILAARLETEFSALLPQAMVRDAFVILHDRLGAPVANLIDDARTRRTYERVLAQIAAQTTLRQYLPDGDDPAAVIVRWWDYVKRRVLTDLVRDAQGDLLEWLLSSDAKMARRLDRR